MGYYLSRRPALGARRSPQLRGVDGVEAQEAMAEIHHRLAGRGQMVRGELIHPAARTTKSAGSISSGIEGISKGYTVISRYQEGNS